MKSFIAMGAALLLVGCGLSGCSKTAEGVSEDTKSATTAAGNAANSAAETAGNAMGKAAEAAADFTSNASMATTVTPKVKTAILADSTLNNPANKIDVDSHDKIVHIKGMVVNNEMKKKAGQIAEETLKSMNAPADIHVSNELISQKH